MFLRYIGDTIPVYRAIHLRATLPRTFKTDYRTPTGGTTEQERLEAAARSDVPERLTTERAELSTGIYLFSRLQFNKCCIMLNIKFFRCYF